VMFVMTLSVARPRAGFGSHLDALRAPSWKNRPAPFPGWMSQKATKPGSVWHFCLPGFLISVFC